MLETKRKERDFQLSKDNIAFTSKGIELTGCKSVISFVLLRKTECLRRMFSLYFTGIEC